MKNVRIHIAKFHYRESVLNEVRRLGLLLKPHYPQYSWDFLEYMEHYFDIHNWNCFIPPQVHFHWDNNGVPSVSDKDKHLIEKRFLYQFLKHIKTEPINFYMDYFFDLSKSKVVEPKMVSHDKVGVPSEMRELLEHLRHIHDVFFVKKFIRDLYEGNKTDYYFSDEYGKKSQIIDDAIKRAIKQVLKLKKNFFKEMKWGKGTLNKKCVDVMKEYDINPTGLECDKPKGNKPFRTCCSTKVYLEYKPDTIKRSEENIIRQELGKMMEIDYRQASDLLPKKPKHKFDDRNVRNEKRDKLIDELFSIPFEHQQLTQKWILPSLDSRIEQYSLCNDHHYKVLEHLYNNRDEYVEMVGNHYFGVITKWFYKHISWANSPIEIGSKQQNIIGKFIIEKMFRFITDNDDRRYGFNHSMVIADSMENVEDNMEAMRVHYEDYVDDNMDISTEGMYSELPQHIQKKVDRLSDVDTIKWGVMIYLSDKEYDKQDEVIEFYRSIEYPRHYIGHSWTTDKDWSIPYFIHKHEMRKSFGKKKKTAKGYMAVYKLNKKSVLCYNNRGDDNEMEVVIKKHDIDHTKVEMKEVEVDLSKMSITKETDYKGEIPPNPLSNTLEYPPNQP